MTKYGKNVKLPEVTYGIKSKYKKNQLQDGKKIMTKSKLWYTKSLWQNLNYEMLIYQYDIKIGIMVKK